MISRHKHPAEIAKTIAKVREINRRAGPESGQSSFDALGVLVVDLANDGSPVTIVRSAHSSRHDGFQYDRMITRAAHPYDYSFGNV